MKYTCEVTIDKPLDEVVALFADLDSMYQWQKGLKSFEIIEGDPDTRLKTKLLYEMNGRNIEMIETIISSSSSSQSAIYEAKNVWNRCDNKFTAVNNKTIWQMNTEFRCKGMMKVIALFGKKGFINQTQSDMESFKSFVENEA